MNAVCLQVKANIPPDFTKIARNVGNIARDIGNIPCNLDNNPCDFTNIPCIGGFNLQADERNACDIGNIAQRRQCDLSQDISSVSKIKGV